MNEILKALYEGKIVRFKSNNNLYYKKSNGQYYYTSSIDEEIVSWTLSNADDEIFEMREAWKIVEN